MIWLQLWVLVPQRLKLPLNLVKTLSLRFFSAELFDLLFSCFDYLLVLSLKYLKLLLTKDESLLYSYYFSGKVRIDFFLLFELLLKRFYLWKGWCGIVWVLFELFLKRLDLTVKVLIMHLKLFVSLTKCLKFSVLTCNSLLELYIILHERSTLVFKGCYSGLESWVFLLYVIGQVRQI
jgi:hypothetical protein